ncbi:hypothetical protein [Pseudomonas frederiksbergensis]|uniref:hypothetical protein n=1 Tax=Pseudomonas frederiksbergensis TaxID=104087 RepID=UPI000F46C430|nr:hypothetical protein [Pseudomonas frederiksbergensis]RON49546.1 hypothetical protein BK667_19930 [Pseudomonas frederiksbergensis]
MRKIFNDHLSKVLNEKEYNLRNDYWLWLHLILNNFNLLPYDTDTQGMRDKMAIAIEEDTTRNNADIIKNRRTEQLLPTNEFDWINEGERQVEWLRTKTFTFIGEYNFPPPSGLEGKDLLIAKIDLWAVDISKKKLALSVLKAQWTAHKKGDIIFRWFKDDDQKCLLAWEWLSKHSQPHAPPPQRFENYDGLLIFFDNNNLIHEQKLLYIEKIRKSWNQKNYRKSQNGKNQYNFILSDKSIGRLDKLCDAYDLSRAKILDILLKMEAEQNRYLPERIRLLKDES